MKRPTEEESNNTPLSGTTEIQGQPATDDGEKPESPPSSENANGGCDLAQPIQLRSTYALQDEQIANEENRSANSTRTLQFSCDDEVGQEPAEEVAQPSNSSDNVPHKQAEEFGAAELSIRDTLLVNTGERSSSQRESAARRVHDLDVIAFLHARFGVSTNVAVEGRSVPEMMEDLQLDSTPSTPIRVEAEDPEIAQIFEEDAEEETQLQEWQDESSRSFSPEGLEDVYKCIKCRTRETEVITIPCGHCLMCKICYNRYLQNLKVCDQPVSCPLCNAACRSHAFR